MGVIVKKTGQLSKVSDLKAHIKYIGFRSQEIDKELKDGRFFNDKFDNVNYKGFLKGIENNKALQHPKSIKGHKFVFSLNQREYEAYLKSGKELQARVKKYGVALGKDAQKIQENINDRVAALEKNHDR